MTQQEQHQWLEHAIDRLSQEYVTEPHSGRRLKLMIRIRALIERLTEEDMHDSSDSANC